MNGTACPHDGPRDRGAVPLVCSDCGGVEIGRAPSTRCIACGQTFRDPGWERDGPSLLSVVRAHRATHAPNYLEVDPIWELTRRDEERDRRERVARERERQEREEAERRDQAELERRRREAEEQARWREAERATRDEAERRRTDVDAGILAGLSPDAICRSVPGATQAQVAARKVELAKLEANRGKPWAEAALDAEILQLSRAGVPRAEIADQLHVGAHRIKRVRSASGLPPRRSWREDATRDPGPGDG